MIPEAGSIDFSLRGLYEVSLFVETEQTDSQDTD